MAKKSFSQYARLPEMRLFWIFSGILLILVVIDFIYLPAFWGVVSLTFAIVASTLTFFGALKTAQTNYAVSIEKNLLDMVVFGLSDAVIAYDNELTIQMFNAAAQKLFGVPAAALIGKKFILEDSNKNPRMQLLSRVLFPSLAPAIIKRTAPGEYPQIIDLVFNEPFIRLQVTTVQVHNEIGEQTGFIKVVHDRTREIELLKSKDEFITVTSHQLRTPLTAILWTFQALKKGVADEKEFGELVRNGGIASEKLGKIINDFLDIAKIEDGRFGYEYQDTDLVQFVSRVVEEAAPIAKQHKVNVYFEKPTAPVIAPIDQAKMGIVFSNLIDNAIKYNVENGDVTVRLARLPDQPFAQISVSDTGIGVSQEEMKSLFTKFFRSETAIKMDQAGSGLGLYLVKNIIEQHGGKIKVDSVQGRGTTFTFILPTDISLVPQAEVASHEGV